MSVNTDSIYSSSYYAYNSMYNTGTSDDSSSRSSEFADLLMSSLDSDSNGSIDVTEFSEAALSLSSSSTDEDAINEAFSLLDDNDDGSISLDELTSYMTSGLQNEQTMAAGTPPPPPPPPPSDEDDSGYTQDELSALARDASSVDATLASLFETLSENFDAADTNEDGKVSSAEAMQYQEDTSTASKLASTDETSTISTDAQNVQASFADSLLQQIIAQYTSQNTISSFNVDA